MRHGSSRMYVCTFVFNRNGVYVISLSTLRLIQVCLRLYQSINCFCFFLLTRSILSYMYICHKKKFTHPAIAVRLMHSTAYTHCVSLVAYCRFLWSWSQWQLYKTQMLTAECPLRITSEYKSVSYFKRTFKCQGTVLPPPAPQSAVLSAVCLKIITNSLN